MKDYFKFFSRIAFAVMQRQDLDALTQKLIDEAVELADANFGYIHLIDEEQQCLKIVAASNSVLDQVRDLHLKKGEGVAGHCWKSSQTLVINDYMKWEHRVSNPALSGLTSVIAAPMLRDGQVFGILCLGSYKADQFRKDEIDALSHFADVAAVAFDNANLIEQITSELKRNAALTDEVQNSVHRYRELYKRTEVRLNQSQALVRISNLINSESSLDQLAARALESIQSTLEYDDARMFRINDQFGTISQILASEMDSHGATYSWKATNETIRELLEKGRSELTERSGYVTELGNLPALVFLVWNGQKPWSAIVATLNTPGSKFNTEDRNVLGAITNQLSMAVRQRSLLEQTEHQAKHDELTSLGNRRLFKQQVRDSLSRCRSGHLASISVLVIDLDSFKQINDMHGHQVGDLVLCTVAERLQHNVPASAVIARLGGDEFAVLISDQQTQANGHEIARELLRAVQQPMNILGLGLTIGASIGISQYPTHGSEYSELMSAADAAMYSVKHNGKGGLKLYLEEHPEQTDEESAAKSEEDNVHTLG
jgi:diguanylate cyclase (GGDEF)-like protein